MLSFNVIWILVSTVTIIPSVYGGGGGDELRSFGIVGTDFVGLGWSTYE